MKRRADPAQTTVYRYNNRVGTALRRGSDAWHASIRRLVELDYAFHALTYATPGYLFRGLDSGLAAALGGGTLNLNAGAHALAALERETGVWFVSGDLSDALAVSRLWEDPADAAILVIEARAFAAAHAAGRAAVLAFADPGVVFRYPFFVPPVALAVVRHVVVHPARLAALSRGQAAANRQLHVLAPTLAACGASRTGFEAALATLMHTHDIRAATAQASDHMPRLAPQ